MSNMADKRKSRAYPANKLLLAKRFGFQVKSTEQQCIKRLHALPRGYVVQMDTEVHPYKFRIDKISPSESGGEITVGVMEGELYEEVNMGVTFVKGVAYAGDAARLGWFFLGLWIVSVLLVTIFALGPALCGVVLMPIASFGGFINSLTGREEFINFIEYELRG
jgi:hypothetical protein